MMDHRILPLLAVPTVHPLFGHYSIIIGVEVTGKHEFLQTARTLEEQVDGNHGSPATPRHTVLQTTCPGTYLGVGLVPHVTHWHPNPHPRAVCREPMADWDSDDGGDEMA